MALCARRSRMSLSHSKGQKQARANFIQCSYGWRSMLILAANSNATETSEKFSPGRNFLLFFVSFQHVSKCKDRSVYLLRSISHRKRVRPAAAAATTARTGRSASRGGGQQSGAA